MLKYITLFISLLLTCCCYAKPMPLIVDTDMGIDDVLAMLYLLNDPNVAIKAIIVDCNGDTDCPQAVTLTEKLLQTTQQTTIPFAAGTKQSIGHGHAMYGPWKKQNNTLLSTIKLTADITPQTMTGSQLLINTLRSQKKPITILAIGPLTNIALALQQNPDIKNNIEAIYIMGGAINVPGNIPDAATNTANHSAEWNMYFDPDAAQLVFASGIPIKLIPLDVTNTTPITRAFYQQLVDIKQKTPATQIATQLLHDNMDLIEQQQWDFWDPLAAVVTTDHDLCTWQSTKVHVALQPETLTGGLIKDKQGNPISYCSQVDNALFEQQLLSQWQS